MSQIRFYTLRELPFDVVNWYSYKFWKTFHPTTCRIKWLQFSRSEGFVESFMLFVIAPGKHFMYISQSDCSFLEISHSWVLCFAVVLILIFFVCLFVFRFWIYFLGVIWYLLFVFFVFSSASSTLKSTLDVLFTYVFKSDLYRLFFLGCVKGSALLVLYFLSKME